MHSRTKCYKDDTSDVSHKDRYSKPFHAQYSMKPHQLSFPRKSAAADIMPDRQRIHPVVADVEAPAPQTAPLVPPGSFRSDKGHPPPPLPPLTTDHRPLPVIMPPPRYDKSSRSCLLRCICWTMSLLIILLVFVGALVGIIFLAFKPQVPKYSVDSLRIGYLRLNLDMTLYARFDVKITATNPNKKIGIYYEKGSKLSVWYTKTKLCQGSLPVFYQGHQNTTKLNVALTGQTQAGSTLMSALQEQQQTGRIPLDLKVDVPAAIKLGKLKLPKVRLLVGCQLIVDSLSSNSLVSIKASNCRLKQLKL